MRPVLIKNGFYHAPTPQLEWSGVLVYGKISSGVLPYTNTPLEMKLYRISSDIL